MIVYVLTASEPEKQRFRDLFLRTLDCFRNSQDDRRRLNRLVDAETFDRMALFWMLHDDVLAGYADRFAGNGIPDTKMAQFKHDVTSFPAAELAEVTIMIEQYGLTALYAYFQCVEELRLALLGKLAEDNATRCPHPFNVA